MEGGCVRIERVVNGYTVHMRDPKIVAENAKREIGRVGAWQDPDREYVFDDFDDMMAFLTKNIDKALPKPDFDSTFDNITSGDVTGDDTNE